MDDRLSKRIIDAVRTRPFLYDNTIINTKYAHRKKMATWREIAKEVGGQDTAEQIKAKWRNLRDCYMKYRRTADLPTKKYQNWIWAEEMDFLDPVFKRISRGSNSSTGISIEAVMETESDSNDSVPRGDDDVESPIKKCKLIESDDKIFIHLENSNDKKPISNHSENIVMHLKDFDSVNKLDEIDYLFLSYANTVKRFSKRRQTLLKLEIANTFAQAELEDIEEKEKLQQ